MSLGLHHNGMHDFVLLEAEVGTRVAMAQDSEDCGWSALLDLDYLLYCARELYEEENGKLLYATKAAWVRWEDADPDVRAMWVNEVCRRSG